MGLTPDLAPSPLKTKAYAAYGDLNLSFKPSPPLGARGSLLQCPVLNLRMALLNCRISANYQILPLLITRRGKDPL